MKALNFFVLLICLSSLVFSEWDEYPSYDAYIGFMEKFESDYPGLCRIVKYGVSDSGRKMLAAVVSDSVSVREKEPQFFYMSCIHYKETFGLPTSLHLIDHLLKNYGTDQQVTRLVDSVEIWIAPLCNPDGVYSPSVGNTQMSKAEDSLYTLFEEEHYVMSAEIKAGVELVMYPWVFKPQLTADDDWFQYVARAYADCVQENGPSGYFNDGNDGIVNGYTWYQANTFMDTLLLYYHCRHVYLYLTTVKVLSASQLVMYWNFNYQALLNHIEQVLYGIRGIVMDSLTGESLEAKVFVENHDKDSSWVFSHLPHGDYYRLIHAGTYDVTFSCDGYYLKTIKGVQAKNSEATILDVKLRKIPTDIIPEVNNLKNLSINNWESIKKVEIYNLAGRKVKTLSTKANINWKEFNGIYIVRVAGKDFKKQFKIMFTR